jgi:hypothetical protein
LNSHQIILLKVTVNVTKQQVVHNVVKQMIILSDYDLAMSELALA